MYKNSNYSKYISTCVANSIAVAKLFCNFKKIM